MRRRPAARGERGSASAELVIATPLLLLLLLTIVQFALWQHAAHIAQAVAQQCLAAGRVQGGSTTTGQDEAHAVLTQLGSSVLIDPTVTVTRTATTTTVVITGYTEGVLPFFRLPVRSVATGPTERFTAPAGRP